MHRKSSLLLMEQLAMILIFALAAAVCLRLFAGGVALSREAQLRDGAVALARNSAEYFKATGDEAGAASLAKEPYQLEIIPQPGQPGLRVVQIRITVEGKEIYTLLTARQEALP